MQVLHGAVEGPDLSGQTADRKQTRAFQVRGTWIVKFMNHSSFQKVTEGIIQNRVTCAHILP